MMNVNINRITNKEGVMGNFAKRIETIKMLEEMLLKEAVDEYRISRNKPLSMVEKNLIESNWQKHSSFFTRMWLNYMNDSQLNQLLTKKMQEASSRESKTKFFSSY